MTPGVSEVDEKAGESSGCVDAGVFGAVVLPRLATAGVRDSASVSAPVLAALVFSAFCVGLGFSE